jgi:hypothetical protein
VQDQPSEPRLDESASAISAIPEQPLRPEEFRVARNAFLGAFRGRTLFEDRESFAALMLELDNAAKPLLAAERDARSINSALAKMHGDWFEWILSWIAEDVEQTSNPSRIAVRLPNVSQFDCALLYCNKLAEMLERLRTEVQRSNVELITSNPDFVLIRKSRDASKAELNISSQSIDRWVTRYRAFVGKCTFEDITGYLAAKYTLRPDRRLQMAHEGSLMKALYVHLQTRLWITEPAGLQFYAVSSRVGPADRIGLRTVATHSITSVASRPQAAVDAVFETPTIGDARRMFIEILS